MSVQENIVDRFVRLPEKRSLSIFFTAGYPRLLDTVPILKQLSASGVDMVEIGFPFSDPIADGPTIQESNRIAIDNGMTLEVLFEQLREMRAHTDIPILLMGYLNPVEQYGVERFLCDTAACGADGVILPDMPFELYTARYRPLFVRYGVRPVFLVTIRTPVERIRAFDAEAPAFHYLLSSDAVTGGDVSVSVDRDAFFKRVSEMGLKRPLFVGFGVRDKASFDAVTTHTRGAIVGSGFLNAIQALPVSSADHRSSDVGHDDIIGRYIRGIR
jgi:tryptophan synthase alpha chain